MQKKQRRKLKQKFIDKFLVREQKGKTEKMAEEGAHTRDRT